MKINGFDPVIYNAELLDYSVEGCELSDTYLLAPSSIMPLRLSNKAELRKITLTFDFICKDQREATLNMSNLTAELLKSAELELPDGFCYYCILTDTGKASRKADWIGQNKFTFIGFRHSALEQVILTESNSIFVNGNLPTECKITINTNAKSIKINDITVKNIGGEIVIDGINKLVQQNGGNKFIDCDMTEFPKLYPGINQINISVAATVCIEYYPMFL